MSVIAKEILKQYITCEDDATRNKFFNMLDSFWHKIEGKIIKSYTKDVAGTITGMTVLDKDGLFESVAFPVFPNSAPISFIKDLSTELGKLQPKVEGKGLSTNDLTLDLLNKLKNLNNYIHPDFHQIGEIENLAEALEGKADAPGEGYGFSQENFTLPEKQILAAYNISHYGNPVNDLAELAQLTQAEISNKQRRYVHSERVDFFYDATLIAGDVAPADQVDGTGFWMRGAALVEVIDNLISTETEKAGSANQLRVLKGLIDSLNAIVFSDDATLDEIQEIVNYIKQNKSDLQNLSIPNIAGLVDALANLVTLDTTQSITGKKGFTDTITTDKGLLIKHGFVAVLANYLSISAPFADAIGFSNTNSQAFNFRMALLTATRNINIPNKDGTFALLSDIANLAPVTRPTKLIDAATEYVLVLEDKTKHLKIINPINLKYPAGVFAADDEIQFKNHSAGDVTMTEGVGTTLEVVASQTYKVPAKGFGGARYESATKAGVFGQLKPI